jgi:hypothetical protein
MKDKRTSGLVAIPQGYAVLSIVFYKSLSFIDMGLM